MNVKSTLPATLVLTLMLVGFSAACVFGKPTPLSIVLVGNTIISLPWSDVRDQAFVELIDEIRSADIAVANLETLIHSYKGYAQAQSGGTWMASAPQIAEELVWAGFDMVGLANNHTFDYGALGVIENTENLRNAGIVYAGAGRDLQEARRPAYVAVGNATVALISTASTFVPFGIASRSRPDLHGRPGLNPLTVTRKRLSHKLLWNKWAAAAGIEYYDVDQDDWNENLAAVKQAKANAELVIVSAHAHEKAPGSRYAVPAFLTRFAQQCIENGADLFFAHGPHIPRGIEIFKGKPIFYSLGNFVLQQEMMAIQPAEFYSKRGLGDKATTEDAYGGGPVAPGPEWESFVAKIQFEAGQLKQIDLIPISLGVDRPKGLRGRPFMAKAGQAEKIISNLAEISVPFGTQIDFNRGYGVVRIQ